MNLSGVAPLFLLFACTPPADAPAPPAGEADESVVNVGVREDSKPQPAIREGFAIEGQALSQGGFLRGKVPDGTASLTLGGEPVPFAADGGFFVAFDRDASPQAQLLATSEDGSVVPLEVEVAPRDWDIERVNVARRPGGGNDEEWWKRREPEWRAIRDARAKQTDSQGWRQDFVWPVTGRISGRFGRQRIYRGEPGSYHSGLDIAPGNGVPFVSPAAGVVVLARTGFSLEGGIVIVDHGAGLNSAFIHMSRLAVAEGDSVEQGDLLGNVGSSGRATGPHLHWSLTWQGKRLDPLLFLPPMP